MIRGTRNETEYQKKQKIKLVLFTTPLQNWTRLQVHLKRQGLIFSKREDLSGLVLCGNKVRQLDYLLGDAIDRVILM